MGRWRGCATHGIPHFVVHAVQVRSIGFLDPCFSGLLNLVLNLPLRLLSLTSCRNLLNLGWDGVDGWALAAIIGWTLRGVVAMFVAVKADYWGGFARFPLFDLRRLRLSRARWEVAVHIAGVVGDHPAARCWGEGDGGPIEDSLTANCRRSADYGDVIGPTVGQDSI